MKKYIVLSLVLAALVGCEKKEAPQAPAAPVATPTPAPEATPAAAPSTAPTMAPTAAPVAPAGNK